MRLNAIAYLKQCDRKRYHREALSDDEMALERRAWRRFTGILLEDVCVLDLYRALRNRGLRLTKKDMDVELAAFMRRRSSEVV